MDTIHLLHLFSHLNGTAFESIKIGYVVDPPTMEVLRASSLTIHCRQFIITSREIAQLQMLAEKKHFIVTREISCHLSNIGSVDENLLKLIANGRAYCP